MFALSIVVLSTMRGLLVTLVVFALPAFAVDSCPVTKAPAPAFVPPAPFNSRPIGSGFRFGSQTLWTFVDTYDSSPDRRPGGPPYGFKLVYWHPGLNWQHTGEANDLIVVARRLDDPSAPVVFTPRATMVGHFNAEALDEVAMMTGLNLPTGGCWEIAADFRGEHLSYVILLH
jgi:hypothetical protein